MRVVCFGATGVQGGAVPGLLLERGHEVVVVVRDPARLTEDVRSRVRIVEGDFDDPDALQEAHKGADGTFLVLPLIYDRELLDRWLASVLEVASAAPVRRLVFNTSTRVPTRVTDVAAFEIKRGHEQMLVEAGVPFVSIRPTFYLENLLLPTSTAQIASRLVYPLPAGRTASWISARDVARLCVAALEGAGQDGARIDVGGPQPVAGEDLAAMIGEIVGRPITYAPADLEQFEATLATFVGPAAAREIGALNRWWRENQNFEPGFVTDERETGRVFGIHDLEHPSEWLARHRDAFAG